MEKHQPKKRGAKKNSENHTMSIAVTSRHPRALHLLQNRKTPLKFSHHLAGTLSSSAKLTPSGKRKTIGQKKPN